jgi:hypothetical protein
MAKWLIRNYFLLSVFTLVNNEVKIEQSVDSEHYINRDYIRSGNPIQRMMARRSQKKKKRLFAFGLLAGVVVVVIYCGCLGIDHKYHFPASTFFLFIFGPGLLFCSHFSKNFGHSHSSLARFFGRGFILSSTIAGSIIALKFPDAHMLPFLHWIMHPIRSIAFGTILFALFTWIERRDFETKNEI